ncbi:hypothetical protein K466DRAFT_570724 [Polyporus arcularius HHB13444]|uniref:Uncharacterized protein n=1 Tax=Polyporus arcularius HHB13444 TaxID=1314778 RepID=A0A5C3NN26_9APHY|nr:hypothetical protein K466DRAFT_570724 [Polyporus arcularius HHB13444]
MPGTVICFDCQISGGSTSGVFFTLSGSSSTPTTSPTATGSNTVDSHRGAHGPARGSDFPSKLRSSPSVSTTPSLISFPGGPIANITTTGTSSQSSFSSSSSASAVSSASSNGLSGSKITAIVLVTGVVAIVTCILLLLWWVSIRWRYRSWVRIEEAEAKARGRSPDPLAPQILPARSTPEPTASSTGPALALPLVDGSKEDRSQGDAPPVGTTPHDALDGTRSASRLGPRKPKGTPQSVGPGTSSQDDRPGRPQSDTTAFTSAPPPYSQL